MDYLLSINYKTGTSSAEYKVKVSEAFFTYGIAKD